MNYIKRLKADNRTDRAARRIRNAELQRFSSYLLGPKFQSDTTVQTSEIFALLDRLRDLDTTVEYKKADRRMDLLR